MNRTFVRLACCTRAATAAEFALVLPLLLLFIFGIIDVGRFMWEVNQAEKATQVGARMAIVTNPVSTDLVTSDFANSTLAAGELIPATALGKVVCTSADCKCTAPCPSGLAATSPVNTAAFSAIVGRMAQIKPGITNANVEITYRGSGFGYAGSSASGPGGGSAPPEKMEISPFVTVALKDVEFTPITSLLIASIDLPSFTTTLTAEDSSGTFSN